MKPVKDVVSAIAATPPRLRLYNCTISQFVKWQLKPINLHIVLTMKGIELLYLYLLSVHEFLSSVPCITIFCL